MFPLGSEAVQSVGVDPLERGAGVPRCLGAAPARPTLRPGRAPGRAISSRQMFNSITRGFPERTKISSHLAWFPPYICMSYRDEPHAPLPSDHRQHWHLRKQPGPGFRVQGSGFRVQGSGFRVYGLWFIAYGLEFISGF